MCKKSFDTNSCQSSGIRIGLMALFVPKSTSNQYLRLSRSVAQILPKHSMPPNHYLCLTRAQQITKLEFGLSMKCGMRVNLQIIIKFLHFFVFNEAYGVYEIISSESMLYARNSSYWQVKNPIHSS